MIRMRELRVKRNLRQSDLAKIFNVSQTTVSQWEIGVNQSDNTTLCKLADFFNVTTDYLLGRDGEQGVNFPNKFVEVTDEERDLLFYFRKAGKPNKDIAIMILKKDNK